MARGFTAAGTSRAYMHCPERIIETCRGILVPLHMRLRVARQCIRIPGCRELSKSTEGKSHAEFQQRTIISTDTSENAFFDGSPTPYDTKNKVPASVRGSTDSTRILITLKYGAVYSSPIFLLRKPLTDNMSCSSNSHSGRQRLNNMPRRIDRHVRCKNWSRSR